MTLVLYVLGPLLETVVGELVGNRDLVLVQWQLCHCSRSAGLERSHRHIQRPHCDDIWRSREHSDPVRAVKLHQEVAPLVFSRISVPLFVRLQRPPFERTAALLNLLGLRDEHLLTADIARWTASEFRSSS